jgi:hypothetical protein
MTLSWPDGDRIFERLTEISEAMDEDQQGPFLARLVFLLANQIGDVEIILEAVEAAANARAPDDAGSVPPGRSTDVVSRSRPGG